MAKISTLTVKATSPDGTWEAAKEILTAIGQSNVDVQEVNVIMDGVFSADKESKVANGHVFNFGSIQNASPTINF